MKGLIGIGAALLAFLLFRGKASAKTGDVFVTTPVDNSPTVTPPDPASEIRTGLQSVLTDYGRETAQKVEQMFRLETGNFTSGGFRKTNGLGQKAFTDNFPFGWPSRGTQASDYLPPVSLLDNGEGAVSKFVVYKRIPTAVHYVGAFLNDHAGNVGRWNSMDMATQQNYAAHVSQMPHSIVDSL